MIYIILEI